MKDNEMKIFEIITLNEPALNITGIPLASKMQRKHSKLCIGVDVKYTQKQHEYTFKFIGHHSTL